MAIDIFKAIQAAGVPSSVFQRQQAKPKSLIEMAATAPAAASSLFKFPGQTTDYAVPATVPATQPAPVASAPAERAYQTEKARVAQMAAQNPDLQRYEAARKIAAGQNATPEQVQAAETIGMQMWARANPKLAAKVKEGQAGYADIQGVLNAGAMGAPIDLPFAPGSLLSSNAVQSIPSYEGQSDLQPIGTPLPRTQFGTPENQFQAQMFNRFLSGPAQPPVSTPPVNPAEATYAGATNVEPIGDLSLNPFSFNTPAEKRRGELFQQLLNSSLAQR
jgi:hypothetical protein